MYIRYILGGQMCTLICMLLIYKSNNKYIYFLLNIIVRKIYSYTENKEKMSNKLYNLSLVEIPR